jgi:hypothetical protein
MLGPYRARVNRFGIAGWTTACHGYGQTVRLCELESTDESHSARI